MDELKYNKWVRIKNTKKGYKERERIRIKEIER